MFSPVLDAACGSKMFWFDKNDPRTTFIDNRCERHELKDKSSKGGSRTLVIDPDIQADFTDMPFPDNNFSIVVFDPPHLIKNGKSGWLAKKYGKLTEDWRNDLRKGFTECFRVLQTNGTLIFKWNETDIPVSQILALTDEKPLFGNRCGKQAKSHWIVFIKSETKPYFLPVMKKYYLMFESGKQNCEIRPNGHRGWNHKNIYPGRVLTVSNGYGKHARLTKEITNTMSTHNLKQEKVPQWHIDAVEEIYGQRDRWLIAYV